MTGRSDAFEAIVSGLEDFPIDPDIGTSLSVLKGAVEVDGYALSLDYAEGELFKQDLLRVSPPTIGIYAEELPDLEADARDSPTSIFLEDVIESPERELRLGEELCVEGPGLVAIEVDEKLIVSELFSTSGLFGTVRGAKTSSYFLKRDALKVTLGMLSAKDLKLRWGTVLMLENPTVCSFQDGPRQRKGDVAQVPILAEGLIWSHVKPRSI